MITKERIRELVTVNKTNSTSDGWDDAEIDVVSVLNPVDIGFAEYYRGKVLLTLGMKFEGPAKDLTKMIDNASKGLHRKMYGQIIGDLITLRDAVGRRSREDVLRAVDAMLEKFELEQRD